MVIGTLRFRLLTFIVTSQFSPAAGPTTLPPVLSRRRPVPRQPTHQLLTPPRPGHGAPALVAPNQMERFTILTITTFAGERLTVAVLFPILLWLIITLTL